MLVPRVVSILSEEKKQTNIDSKEGHTNGIQDASWPNP